MQTYILAGGCFWCLDAVYRRIKGVTSVTSGYTNGKNAHPTYEQVSTGTTGHAEAVQIIFDPTIITGDVILDIFFLIHDPTTLDRQGNDVGTQYRSAMFFKDTEQQTSFQSALERAQEKWDNKIVTAITQLDVFYPAEDYHQDYFNNNPGNGYCSIVIEPKIVKARAQYKQWFVN